VEAIIYMWKPYIKTGYEILPERFINVETRHGFFFHQNILYNSDEETYSYLCALLENGGKLKAI